MRRPDAEQKGGVACAQFALFCTQLGLASPALSVKFTVVSIQRGPPAERRSTLGLLVKVLSAKVRVPRGDTPPFDAFGIS